MENEYVSKYHRKEPIRKFNVDQSMYDLVKNVNENNMNLNATSYFGIKKSFGLLIKEADSCAYALKNYGVKDNETIGVCILTIPEVTPIMLGINKINAVSYWMDASVGMEDMIKYINERNIRTLFLFEPLYEKFKDIINRTNLEHVILVNPLEFVYNPFKKKIKDERFIYYSDFIKNDKKSTIVTQYDRDKQTIIVQSSGSTGKAKSIAHTDFNFNSEIKKMAYGDLPFDVGNKSFVCAPPWVIYGLVNSIYSGLVFGNETIFSLMPQETMLESTTLEINPKFTLSYHNLGKYDIAYGVPVYLRYLYNRINKLLKSNDPKDIIELSKIKKELEKTKVFISGGDKLTEDEIITWQQIFGTPIVNGYGNNELVGAAICSPMYANKPGSVGIPIHGNIVKAFNTETGEMLDDGKIGELRISSEALFKEYIGNEEETKNNKRLYNGKEWVCTGDLGYVDSDGYVYINGRTKRLIIDKLGYKISPVNSENIIQSMQYVRECGVVGVEIEPNNTVPMAFVELHEEYKGNEEVIRILKDECSKHLKEYERPKIIVEIDRIPHKENGGKVNFTKLEELAKEYISKQDNKLIYSKKVK